MLDTLFATKREMTQVWTKQGKRMPVTRCVVGDNMVLGQQQCLVNDRSNALFNQKQILVLEIGYGQKKLKNTNKPLRSIIEKSGFSFGAKQVKGVRINSQLESEEQNQQLPKAGDLINLDQVLAVGDVVKIQGISKGHGFSGVIKRHGMHGGQRTRGQSDRERAIGSIGGQTPGKVWKGHRMPGHFGTEVTTVTNLTVVYLDLKNKEVWLSGPVPGHLNSILRITKTGQVKAVELDLKASGIKVEESKQATESELAVETETKLETDISSQPELESESETEEKKKIKTQKAS